MAKAKPIPMAITNCAQQTLRIRHVDHSAIGNINSDFAKFEYRNQVELWQTWPARQPLHSPPWVIAEIRCVPSDSFGGCVDRGRGRTTCVLCKCGKFMATYISLCASHMSFKWTFGHYNKQSPKNIAWICLGSAQSQASDKLKGRLMNGLCK